MALNMWSNLVCRSRNVVQSPQFQQIRNNTWVLKRAHPVPLIKPQKRASLRAKHFIYETVEANVTKPPQTFNVILTKFVEDIGKPGDIVNVKEQMGRFLVMTHKAAYTSPENIKKYADGSSAEKTFSSKYAATTVNLLSKFVLNISMNKENAWNLEPWHVRCAFRKAGVHVPESAITMPENPISGPDLALEGKEFYVTVTINNQEKATVRCRIHHWATRLDEKLPRVRDHWKFPVETIFEEDKQITKSLPEMVPPVFDDDDDESSKRIIKRQK